MRTVECGEEETARSDGELEEILKHPAQELGPPPAQSAKSGRMNQEGVPVFYGAMDRSTCVSLEPVYDL